MFASNTSQVANDAVFIEDTFACHLYTGNGSTQTITNGIDLSTKGGLVWIKSRASGSYDHQFVDTTRGSNKYINSNNTNAETTNTNRLTTFNTDGFALGAGSQVNEAPASGYAATYASWTFRKQPKFFDVVTYTGNGATTRNISHNLGSTPGCVIVKKSSGTGSWYVWHRSIDPFNGKLNTSDACGTSGYIENVTSTTFGVSYYVNPDETNVNGESYVAYLFAHDAGGFGLTGTDNVISCGSFTTNGSGNATVSLGYEPQMLIVKRTDAAEDWFMVDNMRGWFASPSVDTATLKPNTSGAEFTWGAVFSPSATGFTYNYNPSSTYIYIAIRRGPMKVPTSGTSVFSPNAVTMTASGSATITTNFPVDLSFNRKRSTADQYVMDRLRGGTQTSYNYLRTQTTGAETTGSTIGVGFDSNTSLVDNNWLSGISANTIWWSFQRAPSFFDEVCYTGTGTAGQTYTHNLGVAPELMIVKNRTTASQWLIYQNSLGNTQYLLFTTDASASGSFAWNNTSPTSSVFSVGTSGACNTAGENYVAYLFATCAGVSKVGSYTGTGTTKQIDCGFTGGARFVLIKRTDSTGDWYVWDTARGIVSGNDPYLLLNSTAAETTTTDYIDTYSAGFEISSTAPAAINASGGTFIFLAIA